MEFNGKLGKYKVIVTEDNTQTLWSEYFDEACHNISGAVSETIHNYILGCQIPEQLISPNHVHVLDVGFGLGIGLLALIDECKKHHFQTKKIISYTSMELDEDLFLWAIQTNFSQLKFIKQTCFYQAQMHLSGEVSLLITVYIGDGRKTLKSALTKGELPPFTAIFQDAFSPKKNPTLWTVEWFTDLAAMSAPEVYLSTYSSSVGVRKSMIATGWKIENAKGFGQKKTMTKARLIGESDPLLAAELSRSKALELKDV